VTPVWLVLPDPFSSRLFFDTGIVDRLRSQLGDRLELFLLDTGEQADAWTQRAADMPTTTADDLKPLGLSSRQKAARRADGSIGGSASIRSPCGTASATASTESACTPATKTGFSTPSWRGPCRVGLPSIR
jgi:hypothetical protein